MANERDFIDRTIATVRNHRDADNCWPQWANVFADEIERLRGALREKSILLEGAQEVARVEYARAEKLHDALRPFLRGSGPGRPHGTFTFEEGQHVVWITQAEWLAAKDAVGL